MSLYFLQEKKSLLEAPQQSFVYVSLTISVLLLCSYLELQERLRIYLAFQASVVDAGKGRKEWEQWRRRVIELTVSTTFPFHFNDTKLYEQNHYLHFQVMEIEEQKV